MVFYQVPHSSTVKMPRLVLLRGISFDILMYETHCIPYFGRLRKFPGSADLVFGTYMLFSVCAFQLSRMAVRLGNVWKS